MKPIKMILTMGLISFLQTACLASKAPEAPINKFSFSYIGTIGGGSFTWTITREDDGKVRFLLDSREMRDYENLSDTVPSNFMDSLQELCNKHKVYQWDGFDKTDRRVCDGSGFTLNIRYADGRKVEAYGMNSRPSGYREFRDELYALCEPVRQHLMELGRQRKIEKGVQGPMNVILAIFAQDNSTAKYKYHVLIRRDTITDNNVELTIKNSDGSFFPEGDYRFYGRIEDEHIGWDEFEALIRKHQLIQWCDFHQTASGPNKTEWYQVAFSFEEGHIDSYGTVHPEHYDAFRNDFLRLLANKCQTWGILTQHQ